jgi:hypothetical protein
MSAARKPTSSIGADPSPSWKQRPGIMPALEGARRRLGGRSDTPSERAPGALVAVTLRDGEKHAGILLWASAGSCDIWFDDGLARRARAETVVVHDGPTPESLVRVEAEVRMFATLAEGDRVRWERATGLADGRIVEKCRYGAIVVTRSGKVVAVGFRKLWPASIASLA